MDLNRRGRAGALTTLQPGAPAAVALGPQIRAHDPGRPTLHPTIGRPPTTADVAPTRRPPAAPGSVVPVSDDPRVTPLRPDLAEVFRREYRLVVTVAARVLASRDEAEDVAQEVFLSLARSQVPAAQARGWLCAAAAHTALNQIRSGRRRAAREEAVAAASTLPDVADAVIVDDERARVRAALARLPRKQAAALVLRHSGLSYAEVAATLDMSPASVGTTVRRAENALRKEMDDHGSHR